MAHISAAKILKSSRNICLFCALFELTAFWITLYYSRFDHTVSWSFPREMNNQGTHAAKVSLALHFHN